MIKFTFLAIVVCSPYFSFAQNPKNDAEMVPALEEHERTQIKLFWIIMYETCRTFCIWKKFCNSFCSLFNPEDDLDLDAVSTRSSRIFELSQWLYDHVSTVCEEELTCIHNCLNMQVEGDDDESWPGEALPENLFRVLYEMAKKYFGECARRNDKPFAPDWLKVEDFCQQINRAKSNFVQTCIDSLT